VKFSNQIRLQIELLEGRLPLSPVSVSSFVAESGAHVYQNTHHLTLDGQLFGTWSNLPSNPDVGKAQTLTGSGKVTPLGDVQGIGNFTTPGFVLSGRTVGQVTITEKKGSITIRLVGAHSQPGFTAPINKYYFSIVGGTGVFAQSWGGGVANLQEQAEQRGDQLPGSMHPLFIVAADFTFRLTSYK
jgi:hypothetical protein